MRIVLALLFVLGCSGESSNVQVKHASSGGNTARQCPAGWLRYEPTSVVLRGRVVTEERYGPPNFGETPGEDEKLLVSFLELDTPISVCADPESDTNDEPAVNVTKVQLSLEGRRARAGQQVVASGWLFRAVTGYHFSDVVMQVTSLALLRS